VRLSEFRAAVSDEFGDAYGRTLAQDLSLTEMGGLTADQAIRAGTSPREVWTALCRACDVPVERWHGRLAAPPA
jgi:hypothetical protein